jgi:Fe-S cluster biogenesis protein NfuA/nitrite reductase/ring-hydroxylating ferredoxin subunit
MGASAAEPSIAELIERVQVLTERIGHLADPLARESAEELVSAVIRLYGHGLERLVEILDEEGEGAAALRQRLVDDEVVASLLLIHDLYPIPLEQRVIEALDSVRPYMESHGGNVELVSLEDGVARIRLAGSCDGCPASASTLELAIKQALDDAAPDLEALIVEGQIEGAATAQSPGPGALELPVIQVGNGDTAAAGTGAVGNGRGPAWYPLDEVASLAEGELTAAAINDTQLVVARVDGTLLAYMDECPSCRSALTSAALSEGVLNCPSCERGYFLPRAGRSLDDDGLQLAPVPLLADAVGTRVALPS